MYWSPERCCGYDSVDHYLLVAVASPLLLCKTSLLELLAAALHHRDPKITLGGVALLSDLAQAHGLLDYAEASFDNCRR